MRFVQFEHNGGSKIGVEISEGGNIVDLNDSDSSLPFDMTKFIKGGQQNLRSAKSAVESGNHIVKRNEVRLLAPITSPDKVMCVGMNYKDHCVEQNVLPPEEPIIFSKFASSIIGPFDDIPYPSETEMLDWEVELVIVVGKEGKNIKKSEAMQHVFGYTTAHDVSARDWQLHKNGGQWLIGKTMDGFCPLGPAIVMKEDLKDAHNLKLSCVVNGVTKQDSSTEQLIHKTEDLIAFISRFVTLRAGDIILTGTPPGVGVFRTPPEFLKKGDVVECSIQDIGTLRNKIV